VVQISTVLVRRVLILPCFCALTDGSDNDSKIFVEFSRLAENKSYQPG
jgi:hypothetical protein